MNLRRLGTGPSDCVGTDGNHDKHITAAAYDKMRRTTFRRAYVYCFRLNLFSSVCKTLFFLVLRSIRHLIKFPVFLYFPIAVC